MRTQKIIIQYSIDTKPIIILGLTIIGGYFAIAHISKTNKEEKTDDILD